MEITGKIIKLGENIAGTKKNGENYVKKTVVIETTDTMPRKLAFEAFGERIVGDCCSTMFNGLPRDYKEGDIVRVFFAPRSREYEGRWFTELSMSGITLLQPAK